MILTLEESAPKISSVSNSVDHTLCRSIYGVIFSPSSRYGRQLGTLIERLLLSSLLVSLAKNGETRIYLSASPYSGP